MNPHSFLAYACALLVALSTSACGDDDPATGGVNDDPYGLSDSYHDYRICGDRDDEADEPEMGGMMAEPDPEPDPPVNTMLDPELAATLPNGSGAFLADGLYLMRINLVEVGLVVDMQVETVGVAESGAAGEFSVMRLRAVSGDMVSEPFAEATDVVVDGNGGFSARFADATLPAAFSPSGSDVLLDLLATGVIQTAGTGCGFVTGELKTLDLALAASTFTISPWDDHTADTPSACGDGGEAADCERLSPEQCPDLAAGENTITSCGIERRVRIRLPSTHDAARGDYRAVVMFHGLTSDQVDDIEQDAAFDRLVDPYDFIAIQPYSLRLAVEWDQGAPGDNADVALFDDLLTCAEAKLGAHSDRLYVAGDSGGGMFTTFLTSQFSQRVAAAAINSGGLLFPFPEEAAPPIPLIYGWGGECDTARGQSFNTFAQTLLPAFHANGNFLVACNHNSGHEWKPLFSPWMLEFLFAHTKDQAMSPWTGGVPDTMPEYCEIYAGE